jgi:hypothetical protein
MAGSAATAFKITLNEKLAHFAEALESIDSGIEVTQNRDGSVGLGLTQSMEQTLRLRPTKGGLEKYRARPFQKVLSMMISMFWAANIPIRFIILKSRQLGLTTFLQGVSHDLTRRMPGISARTIAHRKPEARKIHEMQKRYYFHCPKEFRRELEYNKVGRDRLKYILPHDSDISVYTAGGDSIGRSDTTIFDHWTEFAFWPEAADTYNDLIQAIHDIPQTMLFIESTANGKNFFHHLWEQAQNPNQLWVPIFVSWLEDPEAWFEFASEKQREEFLESYSEQEKKYAEAWDLPPERMQWVRFKLLNKCAGSWDKFHQEYPIDPSVAFLFTGWPWFNLQIVGNMLKNIQQPTFRGDIVWAGKTGTKTRLVEGDYGPLTLWENEPDPTADYFLGTDTAHGIGADFSECMVLKDDYTLVGQYRSNEKETGNPTKVGLRSTQLGARFNWGLLGIESNNPGNTALEVAYRGHARHHNLTTYPNLYFHVARNRRLAEESERMGWPTSKQTKEQMLGDLQESLIEDSWEINSVSLLKQMNNLTWDPLKRNWGMAGEKDPITGLFHDDGIDSLAIAHEMLLIHRKNLITEGLKPKRAAWTL